MLDHEEISVENGSKVPDDSKVADESRRNLFKLAAAGSVASLITLKQTDALGVEVLPPPIIIPPSPPVVSWQESIPEYVYRPKVPVQELSPRPSHKIRQPSPQYFGNTRLQS